jgi:hypothetical protein
LAQEQFNQNILVYSGFRHFILARGDGGAMKLISTAVSVGFLATAVAGYGSTLVIDNFSCSDSVTQTGVGDTENLVTCPGSLGGERGDTIFLPSGSGDAVSTINSNPPDGEITGTIGSGLSGGNVFTWFGTTTPGAYDLPNLDLGGDSVLVQIKSDVGGTITVALGSGSTASGNLDEYSATFLASSSFVDILIPLTNPTIIGTGADVNDVTAIGLIVGVPGGGSYTIDGIQAVPEPSTLLLTGLCLLGVMTRSCWRKSPR